MKEVWYWIRFFIAIIFYTIIKSIMNLYWRIRGWTLKKKYNGHISYKYINIIMHRDDFDEDLSETIADVFKLRRNQNDYYD